MEPLKNLDSSEEYVEPGKLDYLVDYDAATRLVEQLRWGSSDKNCPKCASKYTKQVNTVVFRELFRCIDCGYQFNNFSGTIFQSSKIPLVKHFHLFTIFNALSNEMSIRDISYVLDVSYKTASSLAGRMGELPNKVVFTRFGPSYSFEPPLADGKLATRGSNFRFFEFCAMKRIYIIPDRFPDYLMQVLSTKKTEKS